MTGKETLFFLINRLEDAREIAPKDSDLLIHPVKNLNKKIADNQLKLLFEKLEKDEKIIKIVKSPDYWTLEIESPEAGCYIIKLLPKFATYYKSLQFDPEYQKFTGKKPPKEQVLFNAALEKVKEEKASIYKIEYKEQDRKIILNSFVLAKPHFNSENEQVFSYLYKNPNRTIPTKEIEEECLNSKVHKPLKSIVQNLGFNGDLKRLFFNVSEQGIYFRNPIYQKDLDELGIKELKFGNK